MLEEFLDLACFFKLSDTVEVHFPENLPLILTDKVNLHKISLGLASQL